MPRVRVFPAPLEREAVKAMSDLEQSARLRRACYRLVTLVLIEGAVIVTLGVFLVRASFS